MMSLGDRGTMLLTLATYISLSTSREINCKLFGNVDWKYHFVTIGNIGFKFCQVKCFETGGCLSFEYGLEHLTCHLLTTEPKNIEKKAGHTFHRKSHANVPTSPCLTKVCSFKYRCVVSLSGKAVCVTDGKQATPQRYIPDQLCGQEWGSFDQLHDASREGDLNMIGRTLSDGQMDINGRDGKGRTPLMVAACAGHMDVVKLLLNRGGKESLVANYGYNILHMATCGGHVTIVKYILSQKMVDINSRGKCGRTPVMMAVARGFRDVLAVLVSEGADLLLGDTHGKNILHYACAGGHVEMMKYVLSLGKRDIDSRANNGLTPVMVAANLGYREMFDFLMTKGCNVFLVTRSDSNILHMACCGGQFEMVKYIVSLDIVDINSKRKDMRTPLMISAKLGRTEMFEFIMSRGGNIAMKTNTGKNSLHLLCNLGNIEVVKDVLSKNLLDINARSNRGETAAMIAKRVGNTPVYDFLMSHGGR